MTTQIELAALDGGGRPITLRADQNTDTSIAMRASMEVGGVAVGSSNAVPVSDAASEAALSAIVTGQSAGNETLASIVANTAPGNAGAGISEPAGGVGILGWLSGIYKALTGTLAVSSAVAPVTYTGSTSGVVTTSSGTLIVAGAYIRSLTIQNNSMAGNVWINPTGGTAVVGAGCKISPGGGAFVFGSSGNPMPTGAISAISDSGSIAVAIMGA